MLKNQKFRSVAKLSAVVFFTLMAMALLSFRRGYSRPVPPPDGLSEPPVAIIAVDEKTIKSYGRYPLRRMLYAEGIRALSSGGASVIAINMILDMPSSHDQKDDKLLAKAIAQAGNVILTVAADEDGLVYPLEAFKKNARALAHGDLWLDRHGRVEGIVPLARAADKGKFIPALAFAVAREYLGVRESLHIDGTPMLGVLLFGMPLHTAAFGNKRVPLYNGGLSPISYKGPAGSVETFSLSDIISGSVGAEKISGKICIMGFSLNNINEFNTPAGIMCGTEAQANAVITVLGHTRVSSNVAGIRD
jgi:adenylate cyclase